MKAETVVELMYEHHDSTPRAVRNTANRPAAAAVRADEKTMARWNIREWAIRTVEGSVDKEGGLHLPKEAVTWQFVHTFSLENMISVAQNKAPTLLRLLKVAAIPLKRQSRRSADPLDATASESFAGHFAKAAPSGSGKNRRDPFVVSRPCFLCMPCGL